MPARPPHVPRNRGTPTRFAWVVFLWATLGILLVAGGGTRASAEEGPPAFVVIANAKNPTASSPREFLSNAFLKKTTRWDDGETIRPVDLGPASPARRAFSQKVLDRSVAAVRSYWQQRIFSGRDLPPPELGSDDAVIEYVGRNRGAVGYVSGTAHLHDVKILPVK
jgi:hypothetical protein